MTKKSWLCDEKTIKRKIILELPNAKTTYDDYCDNMGKDRLDEIASDNTILNLVRERNWDDIPNYINDNKAFQDLELLHLLYSIPFTIKDKEKKSFSISAENYVLSKIMLSFSILWIPQYRKYELSQQLRYNVDELFYSKIVRGSFWIDMLEEESGVLNDLMYTYIKYHRNVKCFRDDEMARFAYNFIVKNESTKHILNILRPIHYKENLTKNYLLFYILNLTVTYGTELYIIYDHTERLNCFKICDEKWIKKHIEGGCTILWLYDILIEAFELFGSKEKPTPSKWKIRQKVLDDIIEASEKCITFTYKLEWSAWMPMRWQVDFIHTDMSKYEELLQYTWEYWGVIPMAWTKDKKILDGKKKINYKYDRKTEKNE